jgi:hypothetical protein
MTARIAPLGACRARPGAAQNDASAGRRTTHRTGDMRPGPDDGRTTLGPRRTSRKSGIYRREGDATRGSRHRESSPTSGLSDRESPPTSGSAHRTSPTRGAARRRRRRRRVRSRVKDVPGSTRRPEPSIPGRVNGRFSSGVATFLWRRLDRAWRDELRHALAFCLERGWSAVVSAGRCH